MSLRNSIQQQFQKNSEYAIPEHAINQSQSLNALSRDLYTDSKRFVYELLQNADDSAIAGNKVKVAIRLWSNQLVVAHTGKPFDSRDLRGLCGINDGVKKNAPDKTGFKGIGFKAVFGQSNHVTVFSDGEYLRFDSNFKHDNWKTEWAESQQTWETDNGRLFELPWQIIPIYTNPNEVNSEIRQFLESNDFTVATIISLSHPDDTLEAIRELSESVDMFLFLKNIEEINFNTGEQQKISIREIQNQQIALSINDSLKARWLMHTVSLTIPLPVKSSIQNDLNVPPKLKAVDKIELTLAAKVGDDGIESLTPPEKLLYAYLPTGEKKYPLPVLVNTTFLTTASREALHSDSVWNQWLFRNISIEIFKWIAVLVVSEYGYQAYKIIPDRLISFDKLTSDFNEGFEEAINNVPFVLTETHRLVTVKEALIDFTFLSEKFFIGKTAIRNFIERTSNVSTLNSNSFVPNTGNGRKLKSIGVFSFDWNKVKELLQSREFISITTVANNISLMAHLKLLSESEKPQEVNDKIITTWSFIMDHKRQLRSPQDIFFPAPDDLHWNNPDSELSFVHPEIQDWLQQHLEVRNWLNSLGVVEKSDVAYLDKTIIPSAESFITPENAVDTIRFIFNLFQKGEINGNKISQLSSLKVLTLEGSLLPASECYFSNSYEPRMRLETMVQIDFFLSNTYLPNYSDVSGWKHFFGFMGVKEGVEVARFPNRTSKASLIAKGFRQEYFNLPDKTFTPFITSFNASEYAGISTLFLLANVTTNFIFGKAFWLDIIRNINPLEIVDSATAFWGDHSRPGWLTGNKVENYVKWYIQNSQCIPTVDEQCLPTSQVILNLEDVKDVAGKYLPVFDGETLNAEWRSFFQFRSQLSLQDYLLLLTRVSEDPRADNKGRIRTVYEYLLTSYTNWNSEEQTIVSDWAENNKLLDQNNVFRNCTELKHYLDGDNSIFQNAYYFIYLPKAIRLHPALPDLLALLGIEVLRQSLFQLAQTNSSTSSELRNKLEEILPYLALWTADQVQGGFDQQLYTLEQSFEELEIKQADELRITYGDWNKKVNVHLIENKLFVLTNWEHPKVLLTLPDKLCDYFHVRGHQQQMNFLLKADISQIRDYFESEGIDLASIPLKKNKEEYTISNSSVIPEQVIPYRTVVNYKELWQESLKRNQTLIAAADGNSQTLLLNGLQYYSPNDSVSIYHFTHIENAVSIIKEGAIKSRSSASFKDSAGSSIIGQTAGERKDFARFYFRSHTPTQYYVENLGKGDMSLERLKSDPVCPVPVFFVIPIQEALRVSEWNVSLGTMASSQVEFGNSLETVSRFDFEGVYKTKAELSHNRYMASAAQEFLVKGELPISELSYGIVVQNENAKSSLLAMLDNESWSDRIQIDSSLYYNINPKVETKITSNELTAWIDKGRTGQMLLQIQKNEIWRHISGDGLDEFETEDLTTIFSENRISFSGNTDVPDFNIFYCYKGHIWLVDTNCQTNHFNTDYVRVALNKWFESSDNSPEGLIKILKTHPELLYWYEQSVEGPDGLTLEQHTLAVMNNYLNYFLSKQSVLSDDKTFLLFLALHDIGKPQAIVMGDKIFQHEQSIKIIDQLRPMLPVEKETIEKIEFLIDGDIIGKYLNPKFSVSKEESLSEINKLAQKLNITVNELWHSLIIYYQCDAAGYSFLRKRLFVEANESTLLMTESNTRLLFNSNLEIKFEELERATTEN